MDSTTSRLPYKAPGSKKKKLSLLEKKEKKTEKAAKEQYLANVFRLNVNKGTFLQNIETTDVTTTTSYGTYNK